MKSNHRSPIWSKCLLLGAVALAGCEEPNASPELKPAVQMAGLDSHEPPNFVALTDWNMDSVPGAGWQWCGYSSCGWSPDFRAIPSQDPSDPGSAPNVFTWSSTYPAAVGFYGGPFRREIYSAFWWKGNGPASLASQNYSHGNPDATMWLGLTESNTVVVSFSHFPDDFSSLENSSCRRDWEGYNYCELRGNVNGGNVTLDPSRWHRIEWYVKAANLRDGIVRVWVDGVQIADYTTVSLEDVYLNQVYKLGTIGSYDDVRISLPRATPPPAMVKYFYPIRASSSSVDLWFQPVNDGTGPLARYSMRYAPTPINWGTAQPVLQGSCSSLSGGYPNVLSLCTVAGLAPATSYDFQLVSYREDSTGNKTYGPLSVITTMTTLAENTPWPVLYLYASQAGPDSMVISFGEVEDGTGHPASYQVRYAPSPMTWGSATAVQQGTCAGPIASKGGYPTIYGPLRTCTVLGLTPATKYDFQMVAFRGRLNVDAVFGELSKVITMTTPAGPRPHRPGDWKLRRPLLPMN